MVSDVGKKNRNHFDCGSFVLNNSILFQCAGNRSSNRIIMPASHKKYQTDLSTFVFLMIQSAGYVEFNGNK